MCRTVARCGSIFHSPGAAGEWFGSGQATPTWRGAITSFFVCLAGIAVVNQFCRGNVMGRCQYEDEIVMVVPRTKVPLPASHGFVDAASEESQTGPRQPTSR